MSNILLNRSFESGNIDNWTKGGTVSKVTKSSTFVYNGTYAVKFTDPTSDYTGREIISDEYSASPGVPYTAGIWFYIKDKGILPSSTSTSHIRYRMVFYDSSHSIISYGYWNASYQNRGWYDVTTWDAWIYRTFDFTSPAGTAYIVAFIDTKEEDYPPGSGIYPDNDVYVDYVLLDEGVHLYTEDNQRIVGAIGNHYDEDNQRIYGYIMGPIPSDDDYRIRGLIVDDVYRDTFLIVGEIARKVEWLDDPDVPFLDEEAKKCNFPQKRVLFFHPLLPDNDVAGPGGELKYVDLTDRVTQIGNITRDMAKSPTDSPRLVVSDLTIQADNRDYYFSDRNENSPFYDILAASGNYVGWEDGGRVEVWCGFNYQTNLTKLILKAKMVILNIQTISNTGLATISLKDYSSNMLDTLVGVPTADAGLERPLEYPTFIFARAGANVDTDWLEFRTDWTDAFFGVATWVKVYMDLPVPGVDNPLGKHTRAILMQEAMNRPFVSPAPIVPPYTGLVRGLAVTGASSDESFTVTFNEETQRYTWAASGCTYLYMRTNPGPNCSTRWGWGGSSVHGSATETEIESSDGSAYAFPTSGDTINFTTLLQSLIEDIGGWAAGDVSIETVALDFYNVRWDNTSLLTAIASVVQCGNGAMWMDDNSKIFFRTFENMPTTEGPALTGDENYRQLIYVGQDALKKIRKVTVQGKFDTLVGEVASGALIGTEYNISSSVLDGCTSGWAQIMAQAYYNRYNITPTSVVIKAEYLPSLQLSNRVSIVEPSSLYPIPGQVTSVNLNPSGFTSDITIIPFTLSHTWRGKADWDDFLAEDGGLYVPHDVQPLQTMLLGLTGYREYVFDSETAAPRWLNFSYDATLDHKVYFLDHCDYTWIGRYTLSTLMTDTTLGGVAYDGANYVMLLDASGLNTSTLCIVDGLSDETPAHYLDYIIDTTFKMRRIYKYPPGSTESKSHYFAQTSRWIDNLNYLIANIRGVGGDYSPLVGAWYGGTYFYLNGAFYTSSGGSFSYLELDTWYSQTLSVLGATMHQQISGHVDQGTFPIAHGGVTALQSPWTGMAKAGAGFARSKGEISKLELSSNAAPNSTTPVFEFSTCPDTSIPIPIWSVYTTDITAAGGDRYLKVKVTLARGTKYDTVPFLNYMTVAYSI